MNAIRKTIMMLKAIFAWRRICNWCNGHGRIPAGLNTLYEQEFENCALCRGTGELR